MRLTEDDLTAIEERNTRAIGFNHHALTDIPRLLSEVRSLQALERTAWADYQACAAERDAALDRERTAERKRGER